VKSESFGDRSAWDPGSVSPLRVIAAAVVEDDRLLLVSKRAAPAMFYLPGGKPEPREEPLACLRRELAEELAVGVDDVELLGDVRAPAALEDVEMLMTVYRCRLVGTPTPAAEIAALAWWPDGRVLTLAPAVRDHVIPRLLGAAAL